MYTCQCAESGTVLITLNAILSSLDFSCRVNQLGVKFCNDQLGVYVLQVWAGGKRVGGFVDGRVIL